MFRGYCQIEQEHKWERINTFINLLDENHIKYNETKTTNIVEVTYENKIVLLSLKPSREFKTVKMKLNNKWTRKIITKLIPKLGKKTPKEMAKYLVESLYENHIYYLDITDVIICDIDADEIKETILDTIETNLKDYLKENNIKMKDIKTELEKL
jgi:hypothetical protein